MRIKVDTSRCVGHARCFAIAPEVYELNDDGYNVTEERDVAPQLELAARRGAKACPERVITIIEE